MFKIAITGPESSGKTTLAIALATHYQTAYVPEFSRLYLENHGAAYQEADLLEIAKGQSNWELVYARDAKRLLVCDTDLLVIKIWSEVRFQECHPWIERQLHLHPYDLFLLCKPDLPWEADPLRENPHDQDQLYELYVNALEDMHATYVEIGGLSFEQRMEKAVSFVDRMLGLQDSGKGSSFVPPLSA
jgi:NadR type nicotinamide-nucleotide adenylyltransferase